MAKEWHNPSEMTTKSRDLALKILKQQLECVKERLRLETGSPFGSSSTGFHPDYRAADLAWRAMYNQCPECGSEDTAVENHDLMWHDGDVVCQECRCYVRGYDAG